VQAAGIGGGPADLTRILAGDADHPNADIGTVKVGDGGLRNAEIKATRNVGAVTTTGGLEDTLVIAGLDPGPNGQYGKFGDLIDRAADNVRNLKARFGTVKANAYAGDVRIMTGGVKLGTFTIAGRKWTTSTETPEAVLTLIHTKENVSTIV